MCLAVVLLMAVVCEVLGCNASQPAAMQTGAAGATLTSAAGASGAAAGATAAAGVGGQAAPGACDVHSDVFSRSCGNSVCHEGTINGLDLLGRNVEARLLDVPAGGPICKSSGLKLINSAMPEQSLLLLKLTPNPPCGSPMPLGSGPSGLTQAQLDCVKAFVHQLAGR